MLVCIHCSPQLQYLKGLWEALRATSSPEGSGMGAGNDLGVEGKVRKGRGGIRKGFVGFASVRNEQDDTHPQNKLVWLCVWMQFLRHEEHVLHKYGMREKRYALKRRTGFCYTQLFALLYIVVDGFVATFWNVLCQRNTELCSNLFSSIYSATSYYFQSLLFFVLQLWLLINHC